MTKQLNKKGTSLVELIAVIVIMGIIAGIAIPTTIAVINRQKKNAAVKSAETVFSAAKSVLLEASAGESIGYVTKATPEDGSTTYTTTSTLLATNSEIEKDPSDGNGAMTIVYTIPANGQNASYSVSFTANYKINGVGITFDGCTFHAC